MKAFRFMANPSTDAAGFVPPAIRDGSTRRERCGRFALSFFSTLADARARYRELAKRVDMASKCGTHIGEIDLLAEDGVMSAPSATGHVDLHQEAGVLFAVRVTAYHAP